MIKQYTIEQMMNINFFNLINNDLKNNDFPDLINIKLL